jgi:tRNA 2-selenouridine synthase
VREAAVVEIDRPVAVRVEQLVAVYGPQGKDNLRQATERIARRLGPQRTTAALAAIDAGDWASACLEMLDYYDRCYDHELHSRDRAPLQRLELGEMGAEQAAVLLLGVSTGAT